MTNKINRRRFLEIFAGAAAVTGAAVVAGPRVVEGAHNFVNSFARQEAIGALVAALDTDNPVPDAVDNVLLPSMGTQYGALSRFMAEAMAQNDVLFFGDTNHGDVRRLGFALQPDVLRMLAVTGCHKGFLEIGRERQGMIDMLAHSAGSEADRTAFINAMMAQRHNGHLNDADRRLQVEQLAEAIVQGDAMGVSFYAADSRPQNGFSALADKNGLQALLHNVLSDERGILETVQDDVRLTEFMDDTHDRGGKSFAIYGAAHSQAEYDVDEMLGERGIKATQILVLPDRAAAIEYYQSAKPFDKPARFAYIVDEDLIFDREKRQLTRTPDLRAAGQTHTHALTQQTHHVQP